MKNQDKSKEYDDMEETLVRKPVRVTVKLSDGTTLDGFIIISRNTRLSDMLNNSKKEFVVLLDEGKVPHILNKHHIVKITEIENTESL